MKIKSTILIIFIIFTSNLSAYEPVDNTLKITNGTDSKITITYIKCNYCQNKKICSKDKTQTIPIGQTQYFYERDFYQIKKISNGLYTMNFGTEDDIKQHPHEAARIPICAFRYSSGSYIITRYDRYYFCERSGV